MTAELATPDGTISVMNPRTRRFLPIVAGLVVLVALLVLVERRADAPAPAWREGPPDLVARLPRQADTQALLDGQRLHRFYCASCHATPLEVAERSDAQLRRAIVEGVSPAMPAFGGQLTPGQIQQFLDYLRTPSLPAVVSATASPVTRPGLDQPGPLPPLVLVYRGEVWHADGAAGVLRQISRFADQGQQATGLAYAPAVGRLAVTTVALPRDGEPTPTGSTLYTMQLDGQDIQRVWQLGAHEAQLPSWSPDGRMLYVAFVPEPQASDRNRRIVRFDLASGDQRDLVQQAHSPAVSPDGQHLAYLAEQGYRTTLMLAQPDGSAPREVLAANLFSGLFAPRFSADGTALLFSAVGGPDTDANGEPLTQAEQWLAAWLVPPPAQAHGGPAWDIWRVDLDGSNLRRLTWLGADLPMAVAAPNGDVVVMAYNGLYRMRADGSDIRRFSLLSDHGAIDWVR